MYDPVARFGRIPPAGDGKTCTGHQEVMLHAGFSFGKQPAPNPKPKADLNRAAAIFDLEPPEEDIRFRPSKATARSTKQPPAVAERVAKAAAAFDGNSFAEPARSMPPPTAHAALASGVAAQGVGGTPRGPRDSPRADAAKSRGTDENVQQASGRGPWGDLAEADLSGTDAQPFAFPNSSPGFGSPDPKTPFKFGGSGTASTFH